ncbi:MAG: lysophospholipid acyltransferase family protein [Bacteroidetes bacterium]|nr:lysophospholipid acyltransferase family protein [Bacteroidota bacterium]
MKNKVEYLLFKSFEKLFQLLGLDLSRKFSPILAAIFYYLIPIRKTTVIENLKIAFPDYNLDRIKSIAFDCYKSFAITLVEILYMPQMNEVDIKNKVICENLEFLRSKYVENKGVILLFAHFGNWEYLGASVGVQLNLPLSAIIKEQRNPYVSEWMNKARTKWTNNVVPLGISIRLTYQSLIDKHIVIIVADQRAEEKSIKVKFFGREVSVFAGPAVLALKTGAPIICAIPVRQSDYSYKTVFTEISKENLPESKDEKIKKLSQRHMSYLEGYIRKYPEQWLWMHKRWKH